ncbi:hypothetical protein BH09SUM1_BH09SUM1_20690 [soil metagenome]
MNRYPYKHFACLLACAASWCGAQVTSDSLRLVGDLNKVTASAYGTSSNPSNLVVI